VAQVPSKHETLYSNPSVAKKKKKWRAVKVVLKGEFRALNNYIKNEDRLPRELEKEIFQ
jgi:hypothetical protein